VPSSTQRGGQVPDEVKLLTTSSRSTGITYLSLNHWFPEHALVSGTRFIVSFSLIQSVSLNGVDPTFHPMFVGLVLLGVIRYAKDLLHTSDKSSLKRLVLIFNQRSLTHPNGTAIPPRQGKLVHYICVNAERESGDKYRITIFMSSRLIFMNIILPEFGWRS
jgi:hypothetical protein